MPRYLTNHEQKLEITSAFWDAVPSDVLWSTLCLGRDVTFTYQDVSCTVNTKMANMMRRPQQDYIDLLEVRVVGQYRWTLTLKGSRNQRSYKQE